MKKLMLFFAGMLFIGVASTSAQSDTASLQRKGTPDLSPKRQSEANRNYTNDMVKIQASDIPESLRSTLSGALYKGWESGTVYRTKNNDGYLIEIKDGPKTTTYRFDSAGKPIQQP